MKNLKEVYFNALVKLIFHLIKKKTKQKNSIPHLILPDTRGLVCKRRSRTTLTQLVHLLMCGSITLLR